METPDIVTIGVDVEQVGGPDLDSYIANAQLVPVDENLAPVSDDVSSVEPVDQEQDGQSAAGIDVEAAAPTGVVNEDVTNPLFAPQQGSSDLEQQLAQSRRANEEYKELIRRTAVENLQREARALAQSIKDLPEAEQRAAIAEFKAQRANLALSVTRQAQQEQARAAFAAREQSARNQVVFLVQQHFGLPQEDLPVLQRASSPQQLEAIARGLAQARAASRQQVQQVEVNNQLHPNARQTGGLSAGTTPQKKVVERSGNLMDLIQSRAYYQVEQR